jgi:transposase
MTLSELGAKHGIHPKVIGGWKKQAMEGLAGVFDAGEPAAKTVNEAEVEKLHAKIGQLLVERDFLVKVSGR